MSRYELEDLKRDALASNHIIRVTLSRVYEYDRADFPKDLEAAFREAQEKAWSDFESDAEFGFADGRDAFSARIQSIPIKD